MGRRVLVVYRTLLLGSVVLANALPDSIRATRATYADADVSSGELLGDSGESPSSGPEPPETATERLKNAWEAAAAGAAVRLPMGQFFAQMEDGAGYAVIDEANGPPLWEAYRRLGGPEMLGLPRSRPFLLPDAQIYQVFQYGALRWRPGAAEADIADLMDLLSSAGLDEWLAARGVPAAHPDTRGRRWLERDDLDREPASTLVERLDWLTEDAIRATYWSASYPEAAGQLRSAYLRYGLPASHPELMGALVVQRFQRAVLASRQIAHSDEPGDLGETAIPLPVGDLLRESGLLNGGALAPDYVVGGQLVARALLPRLSWRSDRAWGIATPAIPVAPALVAQRTPIAEAGATPSSAARPSAGPERSAAGVTPVSTVPATATPAPAAELSPGAMPVIRSVVNQGRSESVLIVNEGTAAQDLTGWRLRSLTGSQTYSFPAGTVLAPGAPVRVHSGQGASTKHQPPGDLFATNRAVWRNDGDTAVLLDPFGTEISRFTYGGR